MIPDSLPTDPKEKRMSSAEFRKRLDEIGTARSAEAAKLDKALSQAIEQAQRSGATPPFGVKLPERQDQVA